MLRSELPTRRVYRAKSVPVRMWCSRDNSSIVSEPKSIRKRNLSHLLCSRHGATACDGEMRESNLFRGRPSAGRLTTRRPRGTRRPFLRGGALMQLSDKRVLVTGAGQGLGRALALHFARRGAEVIVTDVAAERAARVAEELAADGRPPLSYTLDVTSAEQVRDVRE